MDPGIRGGLLSFEPQNELERSLVRASSDPAHRPQFYRVLAESDMFVIQEGVPLPVTHQRITLPEPMQIQLRKIEFQGKLCIPVFSSLVRLHTLIAIDAPGVYEEVSAEIGVVAANVVIPDPPIDVMPVGSGPGLDSYFLNQCKPFYVRRFLGIF
jgi:hypothetical protein